MADVNINGIRKKEDYMQEVFEKIIENLEKEMKKQFDTVNQLRTDKIGIWCFDRAKEIVTQVADEYNNGWIPVEDRLPEESLNSVLGWDEYRECCCFVQYYNGRWNLGNNDESVKIIAWQPAPESYHQNICGEVDCPYNDGKECPAWNGCGGYVPKG